MAAPKCAAAHHLYYLLAQTHLPATENLLGNRAFETFQADGCQIAGSSFEFRLKRYKK